MAVFGEALRRHSRLQRKQKSILLSPCLLSQISSSLIPYWGGGEGGLKPYGGAEHHVQHEAAFPLSSYLQRQRGGGLLCTLLPAFSAATAWARLALLLSPGRVQDQSSSSQIQPHIPTIPIKCQGLPPHQGNWGRDSDEGGPSLAPCTDQLSRSAPTPPHSTLVSGLSACLQPPAPCSLFPKCHLHPGGAVPSVPWRLLRWQHGHQCPLPGSIHLSPTCPCFPQPRGGGVPGGDPKYLQGRGLTPGWGWCVQRRDKRLQQGNVETWGGFTEVGGVCFPSRAWRAPLSRWEAGSRGCLHRGCACPGDPSKPGHPPHTQCSRLSQVRPRGKQRCS